MIDPQPKNPPTVERLTNQLIKALIQVVLC